MLRAVFNFKDINMIDKLGLHLPSFMTPARAFNASRKVLKM